MSNIIAQAQQALINVKGVTGVSFDGKNVIVYVENAKVSVFIPRTLAGYNVVIKITGPVRLL